MTESATPQTDAAIQQSETPLTDEARNESFLRRAGGTGMVNVGYDADAWDFARTLERENIELRAKLEAAESRYELSHNERLRITRLYNDKDLCEHGSAPCQYALELIQRAEAAERRADEMERQAEHLRMQIGYIVGQL